ncbi:MAG: hypothetical protein L0207_05290 [Chlamydiae bacterium]|nr:hypothetical protein [Chlamydiota bacterium]
MASEIPNTTQESSLQSLWKIMESPESSPNATETKKSSFFDSFYASSVETSQKINWIIKNRGGLAFLTGLVMVPSQFLGPNAEKSSEIVEQAKSFNRLENFSISVDSGTSLSGVIYYPGNWTTTDKTRCILYHNPNGITVSGYFEEGPISWAPADIANLEKCPIILYDYRGTGLSSNNTSSSFSSFRPTYETIVVDGEVALKYALKSFNFVKVIGSSLGGGVATVSLERHLTKKPGDSLFVSLVNHDSFSTTPKVISPNFPFIDKIGWVFGGLLDAQTSMQKLIQKNISITILCHKNDPVIPQGARMAEYVETLPKGQNIEVIYSSYYGHANLSKDMIDKLKKA